MVRVVVQEASELRQVKLGRQIGDQTEVLAGLKPGDRIVLPE
jgi:multidrug efflux pump subunit AcrA (membrane-fusion protein)